MPEQPAEHAARLKISYPLWTICRASDGHGWTASKGRVRLWASALPDLEVSLAEADRPRERRTT
jgi:hypothetical protein